MTARTTLAALLLLAIPTTTPAAEADPAAPKADPLYIVTEDVVYGPRDGMALTLDVITPKKPNGLGVVVFISAGYRSGRDVMAMFHPLASQPLLQRGYTVFAVMHSSQPKYTVPEIVQDAHRAVRFVRYHAKKYGVDPNRLGAAGASAGGHLALMVGCAGKPGDPEAKNPVDRESSSVAAVACFFPPTDFPALQDRATWDITAAFDVREFNPKTGRYERVSAERRQQLGRELSPLTHVGKGSAPVFVMHGDADKLVPVEQSKALVAKLKECGVACELTIKPGKGHWWLGIEKDVPALVDWFDKYLTPKK
jgi:acetyl esterase/lipase